MPTLSTPVPPRATLGVMTAAGIEQRDDANAIARGLERFRAVRRSLEEAVLPLATSLDGRRFTFQASLHGLELQLGGYVVIEQGERREFGQVLDLSLEHASGTELDLPSDDPGSLGLKTGVTLRLARGEGAVIEGDGAPFHDAILRPATAEEVRAWTGRLRRKAVLDVGELALAPGVPCGLDAGGFDRHTFLCGQSGSGKTYSLGVVLERLLLSTGLRIIVLDPNSDFARIASVRDGTDPATADAYRAATASIAVHSAQATGEHRLRIRLGEIGAATQAALLRLDPIADADEHAELTRLLEEGRMPTAEDVEASDRPGARALQQRAHNLGITELGVWAREQPGSTLAALHDESNRGVVVDLGSLPTPEEQSLVAEAVLGELWRRREERRPVLLVIDEAHNVCPAAPENPILALATEHAVRIAAEGRKFGLYMLVSTQRPQKVHENVITQCDNLMLMRLNSAADARFAQSVFSFVPPRLVDQAPAFRLGEALVAGKLSPNPSLLRFGSRISEEGGSDIPATWAGGG